MKNIRGFKIGGLQSKIFNLMLIFIVALIGVYAAVSFYQQNTLTKVVQEVSEEQKASITALSMATMDGVLESAMTRSTALQAYIADDLFADVRSDVTTLQAFAEELFDHSSIFPAHPVAAPSRANDGKPAAMLIHEAGVDPAESESLSLVGNMSEVMLAMYEASENLASVFVGTADGSMVLVNDRSGTYVAADGSPLPLDIRHRPWYAQAEEAGEMIFTGVELDAYTDIPMLECAAPVYHDGRLAAVVSADVYLSSIDEYVKNTASEGSFLCVVNADGQIIFSPVKEGIFRARVSTLAEDLRTNENKAFADFVAQALKENTGLRKLEVEQKAYYMSGVPLPTVGWAVLSVVDRELTDQPTTAMLASYDEINANALAAYETGAKRSIQTIIILTLVVVVLAIVGALVLGKRIVKPLELLTKRFNDQSSEDIFTMDDAYRTGDEIEFLAESFAALAKRTREYIGEIVTITEEKKRIGTELALATRIQADMLPNIYPAFPERPEFDIYASMDPAKEVGGDFYDFFLIDENHLGLVIADVSGKGVPAALFMMVAKILVQNYAMAGRSPAQVLYAVNNQICANNREEMFVTVWFGILDIATGKITAANAGHEYPAILHAGGQFELLRDKHGFVVGGMEGARYREYELTLTPGSKLFVYTDGVPEATNAQSEMFGTARMLAALNLDASAPPETILKNVRAAVDGFVLDAEQFDDLTMLCLEYRADMAARAKSGELRVLAEIERLPEVLAFIEQQLEAAECSGKAQMQITVAAEEIFVNIAHYAYAPGTGVATVRIEIGGEPKTATISFTDSGRAFNPLEKDDPDVTLSAEEREIGGLGIFMTKKTMDEVRYAYKDGQNVLTLVKKI